MNPLIFNELQTSKSGKPPIKRKKRLKFAFLVNY